MKDVKLKFTFSLGFGLRNKNWVPDKSLIKLGLVKGSEAIQIARSGMYGKLSCPDRSKAVCLSSLERCGFLEAAERNKRMDSVAEITSPCGFGIMLDVKAVLAQ